MTQKTNKPRSGSAPESAGFRQAIVSILALGIIGWGAWTMWSQSAPYHPDTVTRGGGGELSDLD